MQNVYGHVVGISDSGRNKIYNVILSTISKNSDGNEKIDTIARSYAEDKLILEMINHRIIMLNADIKDGKIHGSTGSFDRLAVTDELSSRTKVIIAEIRIKEDNRLIGYTIADKFGNVGNRKVEQTVDWCRQFTNKAKQLNSKAVPIQNYMYQSGNVDRSEALKSYDRDKVLVWYRIGGKLTNIKRATVDIKKNTENSSIKSLTEIYTTEQIMELKKGKDEGLNFRLYANPELSAEQMGALREALEAGVNPRPYAGPEFSVEAMQAYTIELKAGIDISKYVNPRYSAPQIIAVGTGVLDGIDISRIADPDKSVLEMDRIRVALAVKLWDTNDKLKMVID